MSVFDHWHPMLPTRLLRCRPVRVELDGVPIVLFRTADGGVGALEDQCPHRRLRLSLGEVVGNELRCRYHGWSFACTGMGRSPGTPRLHACVRSFATRVEHGYVWLKSREAEPVFPRFDTAGFLSTGHVEHLAPAPLELVLDNFSEIEHTPTVHGTFGFDLARMHEVHTHCTATPTSVHLTNDGPHQPLALPYRLLLGVRPGDHFHSHYTAYFSPVHLVIDHWWSNPATGRARPVAWRVYLFLAPVTAQQTRVTIFSFARSRRLGLPNGGLRLVRWLLRWKTDQEIRQDIAILAGLNSLDTSLAGMKLSRFDRALALNRERIERVYRGRAALRLVA